MKQEALADSDSSRVHDERESTALATSIRLRHMEETSFKQYIHDFLRLLETAGIDGSSYPVKDAYEQIKSQFTHCKELQKKYISLLDRDPVSSEIEWIIKMQLNLSDVNVKFGAYLKSENPIVEMVKPKIGN